MTTITEPTIRSFQIQVPEEDLVDLRRRIAATRWPEQETVPDPSQGVQLATMQALARYWATDYDLRRVEARLNALPQFMTEIDGLDIHFIHVQSRHANALPVIITHGWPGSVVEMLNVVGPLSDTTAHGAGLSAAESRAYDQLSFLFTKGIGCGREMGLRPQPVYGRPDSPIARA